MHVVDDQRLSPRVRAFLDSYAVLGPRTSGESIKALVHAQDAEGRAVDVPPNAVEVMLAFEERYGGLAYTIPGWPNRMGYGLDGETLVRVAEEGWAFFGVLDGSLTAALDVLMDGRIAASLGALPQRIVDASVEQRLERHALIVEWQKRPHHTLEYRLPPDGQITFSAMPLPSVAEATGPAEHWWAEAERAVVLHLDSWPASGERWSLTCFGRTLRDARELADTLSAAIHGGHRSGPAWCYACGRDLVGVPGCPGQGPLAAWVRNAWSPKRRPRR